MSVVRHHYYIVDDCCHSNDSRNHYHGFDYHNYCCGCCKGDFLLHNCCSRDCHSVAGNCSVHCHSRCMAGFRTNDSHPGRGD